MCRFIFEKVFNETSGVMIYFGTLNNYVKELFWHVNTHIQEIENVYL